MAPRVGVCVYCGLERELTDDHVPPRSFYGKVPPPNLITVPSCAECNREFGENDDYVRLVLASDARAKSNLERDEIISAVKRYTHRKEARRSLKEFYASLGAQWHVNPQGVTVWAQHHTVDGKRMDAFAIRVIKALFFREKGYRLPDDFQVQTIHRLQIPPLLEEPDAGEFIQFLLSILNEPSARKAWGTVFAYSWVQSPNGPNQTWWLLEFYGSIEYLCGTRNPATGRTTPNSS